MVMTQYPSYAPLVQSFGHPLVELHPMSHVLSKDQTEEVDHTWACINNSTLTSGTANLRVLESGLLVFGPSVNVTIGPGIQVNLVLFGMQLISFSVGKHTLQLVMTDETPGFPIAVIDSHIYELTVVAAAPLLSPVGDPTII